MDDAWDATRRHASDHLAPERQAALPATPPVSPELNLPTQTSAAPGAPVSAAPLPPMRAAVLPAHASAEGYWSRRATRLFLLLVLLSLTWVIPQVVERVQYAITRGQQQAKADVARLNLASLSSSLSATSEAFRWVAQSVEPSVVHVDAMRRIAREGSRSDDEWSLLTPPREAKGEGSGVIVDAAGYVVTNYHVIAQADRVDVHLADGRTYDGVEVVGSDPLTDLAVLRIGGGDLVACPWGDSNELEVGDWVMAVGNPFGLDRSVTAGIISAKRDRGVINNNPYQHFLQTDAAVNPGNSGGPLVNLRGQIVGINTQIVGQSFQGVSFAIPSELAREVYQRIRADGRVARGWLGVAQKELTDELAESLGLELPEGSLVTEVWENSPAEAAGIQTGDVVLRWNGEAVRSPLELSQRVAATAVGEEATLELWRDGKPLKLKVRVTLRDDQRLRRGR